MRHTLLLLIFIVSSISAFGQSGTTITYEDEFGVVILDYNGLVNGKRSYLGADGTRVEWTGTRWDIKYAVSDILYFSNTNTALNPPHFSVGLWQIGPNSGMALIQFSGTGTTTMVLPVELIRFEGTKKAKSNDLSWQTASETQNQGFDIERSADGIRFEKIGFVEGNGTTTTFQSYTFEDNKPNKGISYYRLKQLDFDGRFEYSNIISLVQNGTDEASIYPNPSNGVFTIVGLGNSEDETFTLTNNIGQTLSLTNQNNGQLDMSAYPAGVYFLHLTNSGQVVRLVKE